MQTAQVWADLFRAWPEDMPRRGVLVTSFDEQVPFEGFMISAHLLVVERRAPDTVGTRKLIIPFENIIALKITDVIKAKTLAAVGFEGSLAAKPS